MNYLSIIKKYQYFKNTFLLYLKYLIIIFIIFNNYYLINNKLKKHSINDNNNVLKIKFYLFKIIKNYSNKDDYLQVNYLNYFFSFKYNIIKFEYQFSFYNKNNKLIAPSDLTLFYKFHLICNNNDDIYSFPDIYKNLYYHCIEYLNIYDKPVFKIEIIISNETKSNYSIQLFDYKNINYNNINYNKDSLFDTLIINNQYKLLKQQIAKNDIKQKTLSLKKIYIQQPFCISQKNYNKIQNQWNFVNIYNNYFCFCKGRKCIYNNIFRKCKYLFYIYIIDNNKQLYKKTDYLFADFIIESRSSDDTFPVFQEMIKMNLPVHYMTSKIDIYNKYCNNIKFCNLILLTYIR